MGRALKSARKASVSSNMSAGTMYTAIGRAVRRKEEMERARIAPANNPKWTNIAVERPRYSDIAPTLHNIAYKHGSEWSRIYTPISRENYLRNLEEDDTTIRHKSVRRTETPKPGSPAGLVERREWLKR